MKPHRRAIVAALALVIGLVVAFALSSSLRTSTSPSISAPTSTLSSNSSSTSASAEPDAGADADASSTSSSTSDHADPGACALLREANDAFLAKIATRDAGEGCEIPAPEWRCDETPDGGVAWGHRIVDAIDSPCGRTYKLALTRVAAGTLASFPGHDIALQYDDATKYDRAKVRVLADYDGDGEHEILAEHEGAFREGVPFGERELLALHAGTLSPYAPARAIAFEDAVDVSGDRRPDLLARGPFGGVSNHDRMGNDWPVAPALIAYVAQPDGTFSALTKATVEHARKRCGARGRSVALGSLPLDDEDEAALRIVCARLSGWSDAEVTSAFEAKCPAALEAPADAIDPVDGCAPWWPTLARVPVPFRFE